MLTAFLWLIARIVPAPHALAGSRGARRTRARRAGTVVSCAGGGVIRSRLHGASPVTPLAFCGHRRNTEANTACFRYPASVRSPSSAVAHRFAACPCVVVPS